MTDCHETKKDISYALSLCQEKGHTGNPIVSKSAFVEAQMQLLGTETRRNRMREGCRSHYPACRKKKLRSDKNHLMACPWEEAWKQKALLLPFSAS